MAPGEAFEVDDFAKLAEQAKPRSILANGQCAAIVKWAGSVVMTQSSENLHQQSPKESIDRLLMDFSGQSAVIAAAEDRDRGAAAGE